MFKKNDPLVEVSKKIMQENETRRQVESLVNESLGIEDKKVLPRELFAEYDTILAEAQSVALKEGIEALDEMLGKGEKNLKSLENYYSIQNDRISNIRDRKEDKRAARQISKDRTGYWSDADKKSTAQYEKGRIKRDRKYAASLSKRSKKLASKLGLREEEQLDEVSLKKAIAAYRSSSEGEHWNRNDYEGNDKAANAYRKQKNKFKSYIHKKGGDKAVGDAEKGAKQDIEGKKYSSYSNDTISARKDVLDKEKKSGRWGVFSKGPKKGHLKQAGEHKRYMKVTHDSVMKDAKKKVNLPESEQLDEVTIKAIVKKVANELPSRKKKIEDLNRRAMQKPTVKGWANAQKRVNAAVNEEQLDEEFKHVKVAKKGDVEKAYRLDRGDRRIDIRKHKDGSWVADSNFGHTESDGNDYHSSEKDVKRVSTPARRAIKSVMKGARDQRDAIKDELDESVRTPLPKVYKKKAIKEDTSIEAINEEIYDNLLANLIEAYQSSEDAFNDMVDSLTEEQLQILGFTEGIQ